MIPFPPLETFACQDGLHRFCEGNGMDEKRREVTCQCRCHAILEQFVDDLVEGINREGTYRARRVR